jgi:hypothetical protein
LGRLVSLALAWFSSRIPFVRERGLSSTTAYLDGRIMVLVELLSGSTSKTRVPFAGSRQNQLVIDLINPFEYLIHLQGHSIDPSSSLPHLRWGFLETFRLGSNTIQDAHDARASGFRPLVGPSLFAPCSGDDGDCSKPFAGPAFEPHVGPRPSGACGGSRPSDYFSRGETLIDLVSCASDRGGSSVRGDGGGVHRSCSPC